MSGTNWEPKIRRPLASVSSRAAPSGQRAVQNIALCLLPQSAIIQKCLIMHGLLDMRPGIAIAVSRLRDWVSAMTSIFKRSGNDESKVAVPPAREGSPQDAGTNWDSLRGLTENAYQSRHSTKLRTALLAVLLIVGLGSLGLVLHSHIPALVSFGEELSETVHQLASGSPTPSTADRGTALPDLRGARKPNKPAPKRAAESQADPPHNFAFRPFYATAVVGGRRVSLVSNNSVVMVDMAAGTWTFSSELE